MSSSLGFGGGTRPEVTGSGCAVASLAVREIAQGQTLPERQKKAENQQIRHQWTEYPYYLTGDIDFEPSTRARRVDTEAS